MAAPVAPRFPINPLGPLLAGFRMQVRESGLSPLALATDTLTPVAFGLAVATEVRPTGAVLLGTIAAGLWGTLIVYCAVIVTQERNWRTLHQLAVAPSPIVFPLLGRLLAATGQAVLAIPLICGALYALFGTISNVPVGRFLVALLVLTLGLFGMALFLLGALARFRYSAGMVNGLFGLMLMLGGLFLPVTELPAVGEAVGRALPTSWAVDSIRRGAEDPWSMLATGFAIAVVWLGFGLWYVSRAERVMRRSAAAHLQ